MVYDKLVFELLNIVFEYTEIFQRLQQIGNISDDEMQKVFNCGIGMVFIVSETDAENIINNYTESQIIGEIV